MTCPIWGFGVRGSRFGVRSPGLGVRGLGFEVEVRRSTFTGRDQTEQFASRPKESFDRGSTRLREGQQIRQALGFHQRAAGSNRNLAPARSIEKQRPTGKFYEKRVNA